MVVGYLGGGSANQIYIYMSTYALAKRRNDEFVIKDNYLQNGFRYGNILDMIGVSYKKAGYELQDYEKNAPYFIDVNDMRVFRKQSTEQYKGMEPYFGDKEFIGVEHIYRCENCRIGGTLQNMRYYSECLPELRHVITLKNEEPLVSEVKRIMNSKCVGIHIRRGDFDCYERSAPFKYYEAAIQYLQRMIGDCDYYFFSDEIDLVKAHFGNREGFHFVKCLGGQYYDYVEFFALSLFPYKILTRGSSYGRLASLLCDDARLIIYYSPDDSSSWYDASLKIQYLCRRDVELLGDEFKSNKAVSMYVPVKSEFEPISFEKTIESKSDAYIALRMIDGDLALRYDSCGNKDDVLLRKAEALYSLGENDKALECIYQMQFGIDNQRYVRAKKNVLLALGEKKNVELLERAHNTNELILVAPRAVFDGNDNLHYYWEASVVLKNLGYDVVIVVEKSNESSHDMWGFSFERYLEKYDNQFVDNKGKEFGCIVLGDDLEKLDSLLSGKYNNVFVLSDSLRNIKRFSRGDFYSICSFVTGRWFLEGVSCKEGNIYDLYKADLREIMDESLEKDKVTVISNLDDGLICDLPIHYFHCSNTHSDMRNFHNGQYLFDDRVIDLCFMIDEVVSETITRCDAHEL